MAPQWRRPLAVLGNAGYDLGDTRARPDLWTAGLAIGYSIPYLTSKASPAGVPDILRGFTPMVELGLTTQVRPSPGTGTSRTVAPGFAYAGAGWELGLEAQIPASRAAGQGLGVLLQLLLAFDYLFPEDLGVPLFARSREAER